MPDAESWTLESLKAYLEAQTDALKAEIRTRLDGMDRAAIILSDTVTRVPTTLDREIAKLTALTDEKFLSVQRQFLERDVRAQAAGTAAQTAVNAALQAQKEAAAAQNEANAVAVAKSEVATVKQIDSILTLLNSNTRATDEKIAAITSRLDRGDGGTQTKSSGQSTMIAVAGVVVALAVGVLALINTQHAEHAAQIEAVAPNVPNK